MRRNGPGDGGGAVDRSPGLDGRVQAAAPAIRKIAVLAIILASYLMIGLHISIVWLTGIPGSASTIEEPITYPLAITAPDRTSPDLEPEFLQLQAACAPYSMTSIERRYALWQAVRHVTAHNVPGAIVECGVWRGGSSMLAAATLRACNDCDRHLWLFDTFEGMSDPSQYDVEAATGLRAADHDDIVHRRTDSPVFAYASLGEVQLNMETIGYPTDRIHYVQGKVEDTVPSEAPEAIAFLRLDTDWYESTRHELEHLWDRLPAGGVLIIDDYGHWAGARKAVDDFFANRVDAPLLCRIDYTGRIGVKR